MISGYINKHKLYLNDGFTSISTTTIYRAIHYGLLKVRKKDTRRMLKFKKKEKNKYNRPISDSKKENSITLRPEHINTRDEFGHWEIDTFIGARLGKNSCLLTFTERTTRYELIFKINSKTAGEVTNVFIKLKKLLKKDFNKIFKSFTSDNGSEFSNYIDIIKYIKVMIYFAHPYSSWERGTNEKNNGLIRYFIKKGININQYSSIEINKITNWINNYPRKLLDYSTSNEEFKNFTANITNVNKLFELINY